MAKTTRKKAHKKNPAKRRRARAVAAAPRKRHRARARRSNPKRRGAHRRHARRSHAVRMNPKRRSGRRRHSRRNPGMNPYVSAGLAIVLSLVVGAVEGIAPAFISPKDTAMQENIRMGAGVLGTVGGLLLVKNHPALGIAIAAPSFAVLTAGPVSTMLAKFLAPAPAPAAAATTATAPATKQAGLVRQLGALVAQSAPPRLMGAVYGGNLGSYSAHGAPPRLMGAVYGMGDTLPIDAPWSQGTPFG